MVQRDFTQLSDSCAPQPTAARCDSVEGESGERFGVSLTGRCEISFVTNDSRRETLEQLHTFVHPNGQQSAVRSDRHECHTRRRGCRATRSRRLLSRRRRRSAGRDDHRRRCTGRLPSSRPRSCTRSARRLLGRDTRECQSKALHGVVDSGFRHAHARSNRCDAPTVAEQHRDAVVIGGVRCASHNWYQRYRRLSHHAVTQARAGKTLDRWAVAFNAFLDGDISVGQS